MTVTDFDRVDLQTHQPTSQVVAERQRPDHGLPSRAGAQREGDIELTVMAVGALRRSIVPKPTNDDIGFDVVDRTGQGRCGGVVHGFSALHRCESRWSQRPGAKEISTRRFLAWLAGMGRPALSAFGTLGLASPSPRMAMRTGLPATSGASTPRTALAR